MPKGAIYDAPFRTERSLITLTRPAVVQPGYQGLASHVQWRRNRNGRFTHCRRLTNDLGHGHGVGGSADGYLGTNTTPHTVILDKASSATAPPRNGTRASRLDSATSSALYEPTRLALSGTTRRRPIIGKFPEATILTLFTLTTARAEAHIPQPRYSGSQVGFAATQAKTCRSEAFPVRQTPASKTRSCRGDHGLMNLNAASGSWSLLREAATLDHWSPGGLAVNQNQRPLVV